MFETVGMLRQGGICMVGLGFCSIAAVTIIIERLIALRRDKVLEPHILRVAREYGGENAARQALTVFRRSGSPLARVLEESLQTRRLEHAQSVEAVHATGRSQVARLEKGLTILEIIGGVSPLLGLLGTVLGMVRVFTAISASGVGNPQVLSDGISQALVTTVAGLIVAIPAVGFHSWFSRRIDNYATEMLNVSTQFSFRVRGAEKASSEDPKPSARAY